MKYRLTDMVLETECGLVLHRIRALRDIPEHGVTAGDLGGWIESERNLAQSGDAWVADDAYVSGNAQVYGNARVFGAAQVSGNASVTGNAQVYGNARVFGAAQVSGNASVYARAYVYGDAYVSGDAQVYGNAFVSGDVCVYGNARVYARAYVYDNAYVSGDARLLSRNSIFTASYVGTENGILTVTSGVSGLVVTRGCFTGSADEFLERSRTVHDDKTHNEYRMLIEVAQSRIKNHAVPDTED